MKLKLWTSTIWLYVMLVLGAGVLIATILHWNQWSAAQRLVAAIYILLPLHAWEEWKIPGGFGYQYNWFMANSDLPDRYPMNQLTDMITVFSAMWLGIIYLWIGAGPAILISQTFFAFAEVAMHSVFGYKMWRRFQAQGKRTWYNAGYFTAITGFLPLLVTGIVILDHMTLHAKDFLGAFGLTLLLSAVTFLPERIIGKRENPYSFHPGYYKKFLAAAAQQH